MSIRSISICCIICILCLGCHSKDAYDDDTTKFNNYLKTNFNKTIVVDSANYILISEHGCPGCIEGAVKGAMRSNKNIIVVDPIVYDNFYRYLFDKNTLVDKSLTINRLPYHRGNIGIVQTVNGRIYNIMAPDVAKLGDVFRRL